MMIQILIDKFLFVQLSKGNSKRTLSYYKNSLKYFTNFFGADKNINEINLDVLNSYVAYLLTVEKYFNHPYKKTGGSIKKVTIKSYTRALKVFLRWCYEFDYLKHDVIKKFNLVKVPQRVILPLSDDEINVIFNRYDDSLIGIRNKCILLLMFDCGLRLSEVTSLRISNLDFNNCIMIVTGKGDKTRIVPIGLKSFEYLKKYIELRCDGRACEDILFITENSKPLSNSAIDSLFARLRKFTGIKRLHPHLLRHTFATNYIYDGGDVSVLCVILGHSDIKTTQIYLHLASNKRMFESLYLSHFDKMNKRENLSNADV